MSRGALNSFNHHTPTNCYKNHLVNLLMITLKYTSITYKFAVETQTCGEESTNHKSEGNLRDTPEYYRQKYHKEIRIMSHLIPVSRLIRRKHLRAQVFVATAMGGCCVQRERTNLKLKCKNSTSIVKGKSWQRDHE